MSETLQSTPVPSAYCPRCAHALTHATSINADRPPQTGDGSVCFECGLLYRFGPDLRPAPFGLAEVLAWSGTELGVLGRLLLLMSAQVNPKGAPRQPAIYVSGPTPGSTSYLPVYVGGGQLERSVMTEKKDFAQTVEEVEALLSGDTTKIRPILLESYRRHSQVLAKSRADVLDAMRRQAGDPIKSGIMLQTLEKIGRLAAVASMGFPQPVQLDRGELAIITLVYTLGLPEALGAMIEELQRQEAPGSTPAPAAEREREREREREQPGPGPT